VHVSCCGEQPPVQIMCALLQTLVCARLHQNEAFEAKLAEPKSYKPALDMWTLRALDEASTINDVLRLVKVSSFRSCGARGKWH
jgi:hypothetical protein